MGKYVFAYTGGSAPETDEARAAVMAAWVGWFERLGSAVVDGGNPFSGAAATVSAGGSTGGGASGLTGYSIVSADSLDAATEIAGGCPILEAGGNVEVYETFEM